MVARGVVRIERAVNQVEMSNQVNIGASGLLPGARATLFRTEPARYCGGESWTVTRGVTGWRGLFEPSIS